MNVEQTKKQYEEIKQTLNNYRPKLYLDALSGRDLSWAEDYYEGAEIVQIMPVPETMAIMTVELNVDDKPKFCDIRNTPWPYGLALVKTAMGTEVRAIDLVETKLDLEAELVNRHYCQNCGKEMEILLNQGEEGFEAIYRCKHCGRHICLDNDGTELDVEE